VGELHFTYNVPTSHHLEQGDVLKRTPELEEILRNVHPHYGRNESYRAFVVTTQSCDLVLRGGKPKARYITIAGARPLTLAVTREVEACQGELEQKAKVCKQGHQARLLEKVCSLMNNNDGRYFYLHECGELHIDEALCVFLPLSVTIRTSDHYATCMNARIASLAPVFQAKLGWLVGHMYSRVGTPDWCPQVENDVAFKGRALATLEKVTNWVPDKQLEQAKKRSLDLTLSPEQLYQEIMSTKSVSKREILDRALERALTSEVVMGARPLSPEQVKAVQRAVGSDQDLKPFLK